MTQTPLFISSLRTVSGLGVQSAERVTPGSAYTTALNNVSKTLIDGSPVYRLPDGIKLPETRHDRVTNLALHLAEILSADRAYQSKTIKSRSGVSIGSSRGATALLEQTTRDHYADDSNIPVYTSPLTTAGSISATVAHRLFELEPASNTVSLGTSMTCTSSFHALLSGVAFIRSGLCSQWIFGGSEAPLTSYTMAQMKALRIYSELKEGAVCQPFTRMPIGNTFALGEGAGLAVLHSDPSLVSETDLQLLGIGWSLEKPPSLTGVSEDGVAIREAIKMALQDANLSTVDLVVPHGTGTIRGDRAELAAMREVFGNSEIPRVASTKPVTGHTFGAAGMLGLSCAQQGIIWGLIPDWIYQPVEEIRTGDGGEIKTALVTTAGFGGNSIAVVVGRIG